MNFYLLSLSIAIVILIICLVGIGILMQFQSSGVKFPLHPNNCPDLWTFSSNGNSSYKCISPDSTTNVGTLPNAPLPGGFANINNKYELSLDYKKTTCEKKTYAKPNGINWDGVSNYNAC